MDEMATGALEASSSFFENKACSHYPCHVGVPEGRFNCLLCYCPLYALGPDCGGNFRYTKKGTKDCTGCTLPHEGTSGVAMVKERFGAIRELARREPTTNADDRGQAPAMPAQS